MSLFSWLTRKPTAPAITDRTALWIRAQIAEHAKAGDTRTLAQAAGTLSGHGSMLFGMIAETPDDDVPYHVLADWLQQQGHPRGELIALQLSHQDDLAAAHRTTHAETLLGPLAPHAIMHDGTEREELDLSMGTMSDAGAELLAAAAPNLARIVRLDVDDNYLTDAGIAILRRAFPHVSAADQRDGEDDERLPSVRE